MKLAKSLLLFWIGLFFFVLSTCGSLSWSQQVSVSIWPLPQTLETGSTVVQVHPATLEVFTNSTSDIVNSGLQRYFSSLFFPLNATGVSIAEPTLNSLSLYVVSDDETLQLGTDESYSLSVNITDGGATSQASIFSNTVFGALRGLETFSQLIQFDQTSQTYFIPQAPILIKDEPRFPWRGLLLDTARHYLPVSTIMRQLDAMSYAKFNTLHWHVVDAQSFPIQTTTFPLLSEKGAWFPSAVYTPTDVQNIIEYALYRGIRVVPEFDVPGHSQAWGAGYPSIITNCPEVTNVDVNSGAMDPTNNFTYQVVQGVFQEMGKVFMDDYFHMGGDELDYSCWAEDSNITSWMTQHNVSSYDQLWQIFEQQAVGFVTGSGKRVVVWQEVFTPALLPYLPSNTVFEVWEDYTTLQQIVDGGYYALMSSAYYLDRQVPVPNGYFYEWLDTWMSMYEMDPVANLTSNLQLVLGGEACMWGEQVDSVSIDGRIWPRAAAVAERLWSAQSVNDVNEAQPRLNQFRCQSLARRGISASPLNPDYCQLP